MLTIAELHAARKVIPFKPLNCSHCGERPNAHFIIVIATENCPKCGKRVLDEPEGDDSTPPLSREQLDTACAAYTRSTNRATWWFAGAFFALFVSSVAIALYRDTIRDAVQPLMDPGWFMMLAMLIPFVAISCFGFVLLARARKAALKCPHCGEPCSVVTPQFGPNLTQSTCNCANCGRKLVNEPPPDDPAGPLPSVDEFKAAECRAMGIDWTGLLLLVVILPATFVALFIVNPERLWTQFEARYGLVNAAIIVSATISCVVLGMFAMAFVGLRWLTRRHLRKRAAIPVLNCPHCRAGLFAMQQIIASQRCPACHKRVLANPNAQPEAAPVVTEG